MRCDHKLIFHNFLLVNINDDAFLLFTMLLFTMLNIA